MGEGEADLSVAVDATPLLGVRTGVGVFCLHALAALGRRADLRVGAFAVSWRRRGGIREHLPPGVAVLDRPMPARPLHRAWRAWGQPPLEWFVGQQDVVHGTNFVVPPTRRAARVATVHDLTSVRFPEMCDDYTRHFPPLIRRALAEGAWVHTPSRFVADEVVEMLGADPTRVRPVHHGVPPLDGPVPGGAAGPAAPGREALPATVGGAPYVLALGTVEPRKDLPTLLRAFDLLAPAHPELLLVVAGPDGWGLEAYEDALADTAHSGRVVRLGYVAGPVRTLLMHHAAVYAYPSIYEGFGLPPLEAMSVGVPVVTTTAGALPEVVGDAALCVAPRDPAALAAALARALEDTGLRDQLVARGTARVASFSWEATAEGLAGLYRDAASCR